MIVKVIDLTIRQIIEICDKHKGNCRCCSLWFSKIKCHDFNKYTNSKCNLWRKELENMEVKLNEEKD